MVTAILVLCDGPEAFEAGRALARGLDPEAEVERLDRLAEGSGRSDVAETAEALEAAERLASAREPAATVVCGDGNAALGAALALVKLGIPTARLGAGVRSGDEGEGGEVNRRLCDRLADLLLCPDGSARERLMEEGLGARARVVGDPLRDRGPAVSAIAAWLDAYTSGA